eukprot:TRINITY_DN637_c0_g1_i3.p1 TRINITY_DN637_c0_g1~~TRINITY_DN637_c0_g1_i3.p1  ORF type:complete len:467 (+),score=90.31 TRINITY_DN637_c0_g1_i3:150-1550(+)
MSFLDDARTSLITSVVDPKHEAAPPSSGSHATPPKEHALCCNLLPKQQLWHVAVLVPATAACIVLFAFGQTGNEWGIDLILSSGQDDSNEKTLKQFNLFQSIDALQDENQYGLAALLWVTSVFWPYIKCILTLFIFFAALRWPKLEWALPWVEHLGKWNHVDVIVCYLMMLVIRVKITAQDIEQGDPKLGGFGDLIAQLLEKWLLPKAPLPLELQVNGQSGLYLYCTGVCFSMLTGHLIEWMVWSRGNEQSSVVSSMIGDTPRYRHTSRLTALRLSGPDDQRKAMKLKLSELVPSGWKRWLASALLLANAVLFVCCISIDYIYVEYTLPIINRPNKSYSIITGLLEILTLSRDKLSDQAGTHFVGVLLLYGWHSSRTDCVQCVLGGGSGFTHSDSATCLDGPNFASCAAHLHDCNGGGERLEWLGCVDARRWDHLGGDRESDGGFGKQTFRRSGPEACQLRWLHSV